jgi:transposase-like protein
MVHLQEIHCPHCSGNHLRKNGKSVTGTQRYWCQSCNKHFQLDYRYQAWKAGIKEQIIELTLNSCGVRDISRTLHIHRDTVTGTLKKNVSNKQYSAVRMPRKTVI